MNHDRRTIIAALALAGAALPVIAQAQGTSRIDAEAILNDPDAPVGGNPRGDVTIVAFLDYNCPYCKASAPALARIVREDGKIRLVYKDWPVIAETSVYAAQLALAAAYQGRYQQAHDALMATKGRLSREQISAAIKSAGIDLDRLQADLDANRDKIAALLRRTMTQADSLGLQGTPTYLVGPFRTSTLDYAGFKQAVSDARRKQAGP
ncbi:DsbA family protein [Bosea sp. (in: a-proteobacteria)]|uniref:DsbA family protein n=1 Tax=Bosea sp. (in: a-proteobacteria) TaxID=1871050 RepID=UPI001ACB48CD|nr:DsbA family protein [Bosea sp. (in: a-proteobacteria)]MBN9442739.1 DsbA family protein [Bosea sp. (in: a-proteobacteria)]